MTNDPDEFDSDSLKALKALIRSISPANVFVQVLGGRRMSDLERLAIYQAIREHPDWPDLLARHDLQEYVLFPDDIGYEALTKIGDTCITGWKVKYKQAPMAQWEDYAR